MTRLGTLLILIALVAVSGLRADGSTERYGSAFVDDRGQLHLTYATGAVVLVKKRVNQVTFEQTRISDDRRTVGWLETYDDPGAAASSPTIADRLIVYRGGRIVRIISTPQIFWSWRFADHDENVFACTGPTHGGSTNCTTYRIATGLVTAR